MSLPGTAPVTNVAAEMKSRARTNELKTSCGSVQASCAPAQGLRTGTGSFQRIAAFFDYIVEQCEVLKSILTR